MVLELHRVARLVTGQYGAFVLPAGAVLSFLIAPANFKAVTWTNTGIAEGGRVAGEHWLELLTGLG